MLSKNKILKKNEKGVIPIIIAILAPILLIILLIVAIIAIVAFQGLYNEGSSTAIACSITSAVIDQTTMDRINQNKSIYEDAAKKENIPWEMLAAVHFREGGCDPNKSLMSGEMLGTENPDNHQTYQTLQESADAAAGHLKNMVRDVYGLTLNDLSDENTTKHAFLSFNRGYMYKRGGCSVDQSPYVMNQFDDSHKNMTWPNSPCEPESTRGKMNTPMGAYTVFTALKNGGGSDCNQGNLSGGTDCGSIGTYSPAKNEYNYINPVVGDGKNGMYPEDIGEDILAAEGTPIMAIADGTVNYAVNDGSHTRQKPPENSGGAVSINQDDGRTAFYAHLQDGRNGTKPVCPKAGDRIKRGQIIGFMGHANGVVHLHISIYEGGQSWTPQRTAALWF